MAPLSLFFFFATVLMQLDCTRSSCMTEEQVTGTRSPTLPELSQSALQYTLKQYKKLISLPEYRHRNIFTSPYSIWSALALTYLVARGESSQELESFLGLKGVNKTALEGKLVEFNNMVQQSTRLNVFKVANKIAFDKKIVLKECAHNSAEGSLVNEIESADFLKNSANERRKLNEWVQKATNGKIKDLLPPKSITPTTLMAILNAVYFNGAWKHPFPEDYVLDLPFTSSRGDTSDVKIMFLSRGDVNFDIAHNGELNADFVDLPYKESNYSMLLILPRENSANIDDVVTKMDHKLLKSTLKNLRSKNVGIGLPKFSFAKSYDLKQMLQALKVTKIFKSIDMSGIVKSGPPMYVSSATHKAFIKVNEHGTEASGATSMVTSLRSGRRKFMFNRPFAFILREKRQNTVLFMGIIKKLP